MGAADWHGLESFLVAIAVLLFIGGAVAYFYQTTYVTRLGTFYDYPYRGYTTGLIIGAVFCGIGSFVSYNIATDIEGQVQQVQVSQVKAAQLPLPYTVAIKYCRCGTVVPANAKYCSNCGSPLN